MRSKTVYVCSECGYQSPKWAGRCPKCESWNTLEEQIEVKTAAKTQKIVNTNSHGSFERLKDIKNAADDRYKTGIGEFDRCIGGGIVKDSVTIITSPPGGGKSTLALAISNHLAKQGLRVLYASGEESVTQIKRRADRILDKISENIWIVSDTSLDVCLAAINKADPDLIVIDSIQTFALNDFLPARAGNPTQTMGCASEIVGVAKNPARPRAAIIIGQMNKNDELAGLRSLEHLVDTVLVMDGDNEDELRSIIATKNRFGSTGEMGFFSMTEKGLISIDNPSEFFVTRRAEGDYVSGSALTVIKEGSRPIIAEVESLVSRSFTPYPSRIGEALRREQLNTLISILEQRGNINLFDKNVVIKTTGGIKLKEQSSNLAVLMSIASSVYNRAIRSDIAFIADVGLTGELKKVPFLENAVRELDRMGFKQVVIARDSIRPIKTSSIEIVGLKALSDVLRFVFNLKS